MTSTGFVEVTSIETAYLIILMDIGYLNGSPLLALTPPRMPKISATIEAASGTRKKIAPTMMIEPQAPRIQPMTAAMVMVSWKFSASTA